MKVSARWFRLNAIVDLRTKLIEYHLTVRRWKVAGHVIPEFQSDSLIVERESSLHIPSRLPRHLIELCAYLSRQKKSSYQIFLSCITITAAEMQQQASYDLDLGGSFLKDLPPSIKRYTYHGEQQLLDTLHSELYLLEASTDTDDFLLFHASTETIEDIFNPQNLESCIAKSCSSFDTHEQLLLVKMGSKPHGVAIHAMSLKIFQALLRMGLDNDILGYPGVTTRGDSRGKQPDYSWGPRGRTRGQPSKPSVALEVALSESDAKLNSDVRFWLNPNDGNANMCLTLRIARSRPEIRIEKWERRNDRAHRSQVIWLTKKNGQVNVADHPLTIPFEVLFLRQQSRPEKRDLEITEQELEQLADTVWEVQGW